MSKKIRAIKFDKDGKVNKSKNIKEGNCIIPFIYKDKIYNKCLKTKKGEICATETDKKRKLTKYAYCINEKNNNNKTKKNNNKKKTKKIKIKANKALDNLNINNLYKYPKEFYKYLRPKNDIIRIKYWENITRKNFIDWYDNTFKKYKSISNKKIELKCDEEKLECEKVVKKSFEAFPHQKIVRDFLNSESPYRGLLIFHGLGVGKTCSSIGIGEAFKNERKIVVLLQKSIKQNYISQLKECGDIYFRNNNHWEFIKHTDDTIYNIMINIGIPRKTILREGGCFLIDFKKKSNYDSLTDNEKEKLDKQINDMINDKYDFKHTNGLTANQLDNMEINNFFDNKLIIIDEVHNIINGMASEGSMRAKRLNELFMNANNAKFVFLSGTPMKNIPFEIGKLYNILRGPIISNDIKLDFQNSKKINYTKIQTDLENNNKIDQILIDRKTKLIKITRNPYGFIRENNGLIKNKSNNITELEFENEIRDYFKNQNIKIKNYDKYILTLFPDNNDDFMNMFYDPINNVIKNQEMFQRRILGMTSFYGSADEKLIPDINSKEVLYIPMSDYMFDKYSIIRKGEIDRDKNKKKTVSKKKDKDNIFDISSSYRAYSRMSCQFVFPEDIPRPFKGDLKDMELEDDELEIKQRIEKEYDDKFLKAKNKDQILKLKEELKEKLKEIKNTDKEYLKRLNLALRELDDRKDEYLVYDNGNKNKLSKYSPKYAQIIKQLIRDKGKKNKGLKFIYTEYKTCEGVGILSKVLNANGYCEFKIKKNIHGEYELDFNKDEIDLPKFATWVGDEDSDILLQIFNNNLDNLPNKIKRQVKNISITNKNGELLEILMTTKQGAEGLNTKNVRQLHVVEPYWNPVRLDQVIGRAVRIGSHLELPKKDRNVDIYIYLSKATIPQLKKNITMTNDFKGKTSDEVLYDIAERKRNIMNVMLGLMKNSAIDCSLNKNDNIKTNPDLKCLYFDTKTFPYSYTNDIKDELDEKIRKTRIETQTNIYKTISILYKGEPKKLSTLNEKIYDYDKVQSGRPGKPIGEIIIKNGKKSIKLF